MQCKPLVAALMIGAFAPMTANAVCSVGMCEGIGEQVVRTVFLHPSGDIWLKAPADKAALRCTLVQGNYMILRQGHALFKESYAAILTALATEKSWGYAY